MFEHNPDINPDWSPLIKKRLYKCSECGNDVMLQTNHSGSCFPFCRGSCRQIINPNTSREVVYKKQTKHLYVKDADDAQI